MNKFYFSFLIIFCLFSYSYSQQKYQATWESLKTIPVPKWFDDGKIGIFIHWGPNSVDLDLRPDVDKNQYGYKDIVPLFTAEKWDPYEWAELFYKAGARYVVLTGEHHDGYALWSSELTDWCATKVGPHRDLVGELAQAVRSYGMKYCPSYHRERHNGFFATNDTRFEVDAQPLSAVIEDIKRDPKSASLYGPFYLSDAYIEDYVARWKEIERKYKPDFMWLDDIPMYYHDDANHPQAIKFKEACLHMIADYVNTAEKWGKEVYLNNKGRRMPNWPDGVGCRSYDRINMDEITPKWQSPTTMGRSWYYRKSEEENDAYKSSGELINLLCDIVSKNGNLLLNVGPRADGTIPEGMKRRLLDMGRWLDLNGEAIYGTRPWTTFGEGDIRFTCKTKNLYSILFEKPHSTITITSMKGWESSDIISVELLSTHQKLEWSMTGNGLSVEAPKKTEGEYAWVFKIITKKKLIE